MIKVYVYARCSTCQKALKWLEANDLAYESAPIRETPPSKIELARMLKTVGSVRKLFNTSGMDYRELGIKDTLPSLSQDEAFALLKSNGNLVKRPFLLSPKGDTVGFKADQWAKIFA